MLKVNIDKNLVLTGCYNLLALKTLITMHPVRSANFNLLNEFERGTIRAVGSWNFVSGNWQ